MLEAGRAPEVHNGLVVFYDHADPDLRYVAAEVPRIERRPDPLISLVLFRGGQGGGGLLQLESSLAPSDQQLEELRTTLAVRGPAPRLMQPDWRSGAVEVAGWLNADELKPLSLALGTPLISGAPRVMLAARLDQAGAALAEAALRGDGLPTALLWRLETLGLAGPLGVQIEADLQAMHDRLTAEGALTVPIGRARIAKTWEEFAKDNLIRVRIVDESGDVESNRSEAIRRVGEDLTAAMFAPFPPAERPPQLDDESIAPIELSFRLTMRREELTQTRKWSYTERRAIRVQHYAAANIIDFLGERSAEQHIAFVDFGTTLTREIVVRTEADLPRLGIAALAVDLDLDGSQQPQRTVTFTDDVQERRFTIDRKAGDVLRYRARARFDPLRTRAEDAETDWMDAAGDFLFVPASSCFPSRQLTLMAGSAELDWIDHVELRLKAPGEPERTAVLTDESRIVDVQFPGARDGPIRVTAVWRGGEGEPQMSVEPVEATEDVLILDSPFAPSIRIFAFPLQPADTLSLTLELRLNHGLFTQERSLTWEASDRRTQETALRRPRGAPRTYEFRRTVLNQDGVLAQSEWESTNTSNLVVGGHGIVTVYRTRFVALGGGPTGRGSMAIELALESGEERAHTLLEGPNDDVELTLIVPQDAPSPIASAREFLNSGEVVETRWPEHQSVIVIAPPVERE